MPPRPARRCAPSTELLLDRQVDALDALMRDLRAGVRSAAQYDALEERAEAICAGIRAAFRGA